MYVPVRTVFYLVNNRLITHACETVDAAMAIYLGFLFIAWRRADTPAGRQNKESCKKKDPGGSKTVGGRVPIGGTRAYVRPHMHARAKGVCVPVPVAVSCLWNKLSRASA